MDNKEFKRRLTQFEGREDTVYDDSVGHPTIGVGFNLDRPDARQKIEALGLNYNDVRSGKVSLNDQQIDTLLDADAGRAVQDARGLVSNFDQLPEDKQLVVADMVFNMGAQKFSQFKNTIAAIEDNDWDTAADEMQDSKWYTQVGDRGKQLVDEMRQDPQGGS